MTDTKLIDGKAFADKLKGRVAGAVERLKHKYHVTPGLAVVLVGEDPASVVYVSSKGKQSREAGMVSFEIRLPEDTSEHALLDEVERLNHDPSVHGILVQMPLPKHINSQNIIMAIDPDKDVDGLHPINAGRLMAGIRGSVPCTPLGCLMLIKDQRADLAGLDAIVIGRSVLVGKPMANLLVNESCTVTIAHSKTKDLAKKAAQADILVAAVGRAGMVKGDWIKPGAIVIDVGVNVLPSTDGKRHLAGDVVRAEAMGRAAAITPVPGGVGPMTIACLFYNTVQAACARAKIEPSEVGL